MNAIAVTSVSNQRRIRRACSWLEHRTPAEEVVIIGATLDAANELAREIALRKSAAFGSAFLNLPRRSRPLDLLALVFRVERGRTDSPHRLFQKSKPLAFV
jgi:ATP-dependent helicase/nuclease subunit B